MVCKKAIFSASNVHTCAQEYKPAVLASLMETTAQLRSKHLDMQFMRRRRQKSMVGASRQWFVSADLWLAGTAAAAVGEGQPQSLAEVSQAIPLIDMRVTK